MSPERPSIDAGTVIAGKFQITEKLGEGGMGAVYGGVHLELKSRVAVKLLHAEQAEDPRARARFLREARLAASIEGEHSTRILDVGEAADGCPFMVMEYLAGESLAQRLDRAGKIHFGDACTIMLQILDALAEAHARGLVHRDVKPANIFLVDRPGVSLWVKVLDFGISKLTSTPESPDTLTAPRTLLGSPEYMSPEQLRDAARVDLRSDLWACGVTLFELLSGQTPFRSESLADLCSIILNNPPPPLGVRDVPPEIERAIRRCLQKDPNERPRNTYDLAVALAPFADEHARGLLPRVRAWCKETAPLPGTVDVPLGGPRRVFYGGAALVVCAGVLAFVAASMRSTGQPATTTQGTVSQQPLPADLPSEAHPEVDAAPTLSASTSPPMESAAHPSALPTASAGTARPKLPRTQNSHVKELEDFQLLQ